MENWMVTSFGITRPYYLNFIKFAFVEKRVTSKRSTRNEQFQP